MKELIGMVSEFHKKTKQPVEHSPTLQSSKEQEFRFNLALEELEEYREACQDGDIVEIFDSLLDQLYILIGTAQLHGLAKALEEGFKEVHRSNMTKMDINGNAIFNEKGKVIKSELFEKPRLHEVLIRVYS